MALHSEETGLSALHQLAHHSDTDPTSTLGPYKAWFAPSTGALKIRNSANTAWIDVGTTVSAASETVAGVAEIATTTETNTGTDDARIVTPSKLAGRSSTETRAGVIEVATQAETDAGTDDARAVTPLKLATYPGLGGSTPDASETVKGKAEIATQTETNTGTDDTRIVTPLKLKTNVDLHINDTTDAHDASAISILDTANQYTATNTEDALAEVLDDLQAHEADTTDAHDASAISFVPAGTIASTNVQAAIEEAASEGGGGGSSYRTLVTLGSDVTNSTSTLADVTGLSIPVVSGVLTRFYFLIFFDSQATATGSRWTINGPTATSLYARIWWTSANNNSTFLNISAYGGGTASATSLATGNVATIEGAVMPSANGALIAQFASEAPGTNNQITAKTGSTVEYW